MCCMIVNIPSEISTASRWVVTTTVAGKKQKSKGDGGVGLDTSWGGFLFGSWLVAVVVLLEDIIVNVVDDVQSSGKACIGHTSLKINMC